ncbi:hypothetical protein AB0F77_22530 [Streptomyces sp. NPDC026672]|uniref:hypothetical protein n=1 Tax=unclassified Streptomyces TaxID=2593676 RepID=UPI0033CBDF9D
MTRASPKPMLLGALLPASLLINLDTTLAAAFLSAQPLRQPRVQDTPSRRERDRAAVGQSL